MAHPRSVRNAMTGWLVAMWLAMAGSATAAECMGNYTDTFSGASLGPLWQESASCGTIQLTGGRVVISKAPNCSAFGGPSIVQNAGEAVLCGDFDVQVDYDLLSFPVPGSGDIVAGISLYQVGGGWAANIQRYNRRVGACNPSTQTYKAFSTNSENCNGSAVTWLSTTDQSGKFRITRQGSTARMYFWSGGSWTLMRTDAIVTSDIQAVLFIVTNADAAASGSVAFDNFKAVCSSSTDTDADGLPDCWEGHYAGVPVADGTSYNLPGSNPRHKDLYVEVDALSGREPGSAPLLLTKAAFHNSPVQNPDGIPGIELHMPGQAGDPGVDDVDGADTRWAARWVDFDVYRDEHFGSASERILPNWTAIRTAKDKAYRYCVFANSFGVLPEDVESSGLAHGIPAKDFMVTLGSWGATSTDEKAGTFMHELGHALGLHHGGGDDTNGKPNYVSVMNYLWQAPPRLGDGCAEFSPIPLQRYRNSWVLNYSQEALPTLDENSLNELSGLGGNPNVWVPVGPPEGAADYAVIVQMGGPVNWDRVGGTTNTSVRADVDHVPECGTETHASPGESLSGFDDWSHLSYAVPAGPPAAANSLTGLPGESGELTLRQIESLGSLQLDCNGNGVPDATDIATGTSHDLDANGVPDECDAGVVGVEPRGSDQGVNLVITGNPAPRHRPIGLRLELGAASPVAVRIYDLSGGLVRTVVSTHWSEGEHVVAWDGRAENGREVPAGVYFVRAEVGNTRVGGRVVLIP